MILTSWFSGTQIPRLKRTGLYSYIDKIVAGAENAGIDCYIVDKEHTIRDLLQSII